MRSSRRRRVHFLQHLTNFDKKIKYDSLKYSHRRRWKKNNSAKVYRAGPVSIVGNYGELISKETGEAQVFRRPVVLIRASRLMPTYDCVTG